MSASFEERAVAYHRRRPGIVRAALVDHGVSKEVIDRRLIGWDGRLITVPVRTRSGVIAFFERWSAARIGVPMNDARSVELYPWDVLEAVPPRLVIAEGVHEALILESQGVSAVGATGDGLVFKSREWAEPLRTIPKILLAYRRGEKRPRRSFRLGRRDLVEYVRLSLPKAAVVPWPEAAGANGGALEFFRGARRTRGDFEELISYL